MLLRKTIQLLVIMLVPVFAMAQVTTSSISGKVVTASGAPLEGASIKVVHTPSGTVYNTISRENGLFDLQGLRVGGPYVLDVTYVGMVPQKVEDITLRLGETYDLKIDMQDASSDNNTDVTVHAQVRKGVSLKTGAGTIITTQQLSELPSISRSITDFTRLTPQANGNGFAGRDGRYNNLQVDGANLNNNFGLSSDLTPGGGSPISLDALSEVSVNIAPYDVRQSGFTGAGINVVTKSGTNEFHGTAYGFYRNQDFYGYKVDGQDLAKTPNKNTIYGASLGGPIIKNKLFFFANFEKEKSSMPGITYVADGSKNSGNKSTTSIEDLKKVHDFVLDKYGYDVGAYDNFPNFESQNTKFLAKIDWNINNANKLTAKYTSYSGYEISPMNGSSVPQNGTIFVTGQTNGVKRLPNNRFSEKSMAFSNSNYRTNHIVQTGSLELNSRINNSLSNQFLATYTHVSDIREPLGGKVFPTVDIFNGAGQNYISLGTDPFTNNNELLNNILNFTDNITLYAGNHTLTGGITFERQKVGNMFMGGSQGHYVFNSLEDFLTEQQPAYYGYTYSLVEGQPAVFSAELIMSQLGIYLQDEYKLNPNFKLTYGLRMDMPIYGKKPIDNPSIDALEFPDRDGNMTHYNTGAWPKNTPLFSPRIGFNWDVMGDKSLIVRGGSGIFSGRIPFVFLTNMPSNSGVYQNAVFLNNTTDLDAAGVIKFDPDINAYANSPKFPKKAQTTTPPQNFVLIDPNFKFPQVWRTNVGADKRFGNGWTATVDLMFTKDLNAVVMRNPNLKAPTANYSGEDNRPYYPSGADKFYYDEDVVGTPIVLENTHKGYSFSGTAQISRRVGGFYGSLAYTYSMAKEVSPNPGSRATSAWQSIANVNGPNDQVLDNSQYAVPHRVVGNFSYTFNHGFSKRFPTTLSLFYQGSAQSMNSYVLNGSIVGDGNAELMYVYAKGSDIAFRDYTTKAGKTYTAAQQQKAYDQFIASSKYLSKHKGEYVSRYGAATPWFNELDFKLTQTLFSIESPSGRTLHQLQFTADIFNLPNLISSKWANWGYRRKMSLTNPLQFKIDGDTKEIYYNLSEYNGALVNSSTDVNVSSSSTWSLQLGLRYTF